METIKEAINQNGKVDEYKLPPEVELEILLQKREQYLRARYDCIIEAQAAELFEDEQLKKNQMERMKRILKMLDLIKKKIAELE